MEPGSEDKKMRVTDFLAGFYTLKKALMADVGAFEGEFMHRAALECTRDLLTAHDVGSRADSPREALETMFSFYSDLGYANFRIRELDEGGKTAKVVSSNTPEALSFLRNKDLQRRPVCSYSSGILSWIGRAAFEGPRAQDSDIVAFETRCIAQGGSECEFVIASQDHLSATFPDFRSPSKATSEHDLRLNEEILSRNLELQAINLTLERQIRRKTEEVWRSDGNYKSLMNLVPDPVAVIALNGRILATNSPGSVLFGTEQAHEKEEVFITSMLPDRSTWDKIVWLLEKEGEVNGFDIDLERPDGKRLAVKMSARLADLMPGRCVEAVFQDMTDRRMMERMVEEAKSESEFFNDLLSHDIMNYAFSALHFLDAVWKSKALTDEDRRYLAMVTKDLQGAFELSTSVRDLARLKTIQEEGLVVKDLKLLIMEAVEDARRLFSERKVKINFERDTEPRYVKSSALTSRILTNLLTNAIKFNPAHDATVDVTVEQVNEGSVIYWRVNVTDYGKGIPDEEKQSVFERFHRLDPSVKGTGLGLYVAKTIAEASGGRIWAENRVRGDHTKGTRMVLLLRKADEKEVAKQRSAVAEI